MLDLRLNRRRPSERFRTSATKFVGRLETLESRIVLNGAVGVPSQFVAFLAHPFEITSIPQDADNDGIIGTQTVTFDGVFGRTGTISGGHGATLTLEAVQQGAAIGSFAVASGTASPVNFSFSNTTPLISGVPVTFRVNAYGQTAPVNRVDNGMPLTATFTIDVSGPTITQVGPLAKIGSGSVSTADVTFSEPIDPATFDRNDLTLTLGGNPVTLGTGVRVAQLSPTVFQVYGLLVPTAAAGDYVLTVNAAGINDMDGNPGTGSEAVNFTVTPPPPNGVVGVAGQIAGPTHDFVITSIPQDPGNDGFINTQSVEFIGYVERTNRGDFTDTHGTLTMEAIQNGTVIATVNFNTADFSQDPMKPYRANFRLPATLLSNTSTQQDVVFRVISSTHGPLDANYSADTAQLLTAKLIVDQAGPTVTQVGPLATIGSGSVSTADVTFSEAIDPATFDRTDLTLTLGGNPVALGSNVRVIQLTPASFQVYGLLVPTAAAGDYVLTVDASNVQDLAGNLGTGSDAVNFTVTPPPPNGVVGVAGQLSSSHDFIITSIPQDPNNDGLINTQSVEFIGYAERTNRGDFTDTHGTLTLQALENGTVIGSVVFNTADFSQDPTRPYRANFRLPATLLSSTSSPQDVVFKVISSTHGALDAKYSADNTQLLTANLVVDQTPPTVTQVGPLDTIGSGSVSTANVTFSEPINPTTFDRNDLTLTLGGNPVTLGTAVRVLQLSPTEFQVYGLLVPTAAAGAYVLTVSATGVQDPAGNSGTGSEAVNFTVTPPPPNGVVGVAGQIAGPTHDFVITSIPQDPGNDGFINTQSVEFIGYVERTNRGDFTDTHGTLTMEAIQNGTVIATVDFNTADFSQDPMKPYRANFRLPATLLSNTSTQQDVVFRVISSTHGPLDANYSADTAQLLTAKLIVDQAGPTVTQVGPLATIGSGSVSTADVTFSEAIDPATFDRTDLTLTLGGNPVALGSNVRVIQLTPASFQVYGLLVPTAAAGDYVLTVDASNVQDLAGNLGTGSEAVNFTVTPPPPNGVVGVAGQLSSSHDFIITSIPQDPNNDGLINTQSVEFIGYAERTNRGDFTDTHGTLTLQALENGTVIGSVVFNTADFSQDPTRPYRANFRLPATLLSSTSSPQDVVFKVISSTHGALDAKYSADNTQLLTANLVVELPPTVAQIPPVQTPRTEPVSTLDVVFSKPIDPASFTVEDLMLTRDGQNVPLGSDVTITPIVLSTAGISLLQNGGATSFQIGGLQNYTSAPGMYVLTVDATGVVDEFGNEGVGSQSVMFTVVAPIVGGPQVTSLRRYGYHAQPTFLTLSFDASMDVASVENLNNYQVVSAGRDRRLGTPDDVVMAIASALYDPATQTVRLDMARRLPLHQQYMLTAIGTGQTPIRGADGAPLDGDSDGKAGSDYVTTFNRSSLAGPSVTHQTRRPFPRPTVPVRTVRTVTPVRAVTFPTRKLPNIRQLFSRLQWR